MTAIVLLCAASVSADPAVKEAKARSDWRPGYEYSVIIPSEAPKLSAGKVEVRELFLYTSGWSKAIQPYLQKWLQTKPEYIVYVREPAIAFPHARLQARLFFTLKELGREDLHEKFFNWATDKKHFDVYHTVRHPDEKGIFELNVAFAKANGVDEKRFVETYHSKAIADKVIAAEIDTHGYLVHGTSSLVVNGKYSTSLQRFLGADPACADRGPEPADYERFFALIEELAASELKAAKKAT